MVQACARSGTNAHITKVMATEMRDRSGGAVPNRIRDNLVVWLMAGNRFEILGWGKANGRWTFRRIVFNYDRQKEVLSWAEVEPWP